MAILRIEESERVSRGSGGVQRSLLAAINHFDEPLRVKVDNHLLTEQSVVVNDFGSVSDDMGFTHRQRQGNRDRLVRVGMQERHDLIGDARTEVSIRRPYGNSRHGAGGKVGRVRGGRNTQLASRLTGGRGQSRSFCSAEPYTGRLSHGLHFIGGNAKQRQHRDADHVHD